MGRDQDGNAARGTQLGAGLELPRDATSEQIADTVQIALADPNLTRNAQRIATTIRDEIATDRAVHELETIAATQPTRARAP
jgi:UDP:flavonoid glycosyltransferase YjiC (YdhE family)